MVEYRLGYFASSLCGHDKDHLYMIVSEEGDMVGLCDGVRRPLANPKKKKKKHVQMIRRKESALDFDRMVKSSDPDLEIRKALLSYMREREDGSGQHGQSSGRPS